MEFESQTYSILMPYTPGSLKTKWRWSPPAFGAELWALAVEERLPHYAATIGEMEGAKEIADHFYQEALSVAYLQALMLGIKLRSEIRAGYAARTIVDFTKEGGFDLVALGSSGHSRAWMMFLGTTAEKVSRHVPCTVLLVR